VGAADLDDVVPLLRLCGNRITQLLHCRNQPLLHIDSGRDIHGRREGVVRRLSHVYMIVWVHWHLASQRCAGDLGAAVGDHFVYVHVELSTASCHPHVQREHIVVLTREDFVTDLHNQIVALLIEALAGKICIGRAFLQNGIGGNHFAGN
jgi:hypothetical protein